MPKPASVTGQASRWKRKTGSRILNWGATGRGRQLDSAQREGIAGAARLNPGNARAHFNFGVLLAKQGRYVEAEREFAEALRLDPATRMPATRSRKSAACGNIQQKIDLQSPAQINPFAQEAHVVLVQRIPAICPPREEMVADPPHRHAAIARRGAHFLRPVPASPGPCIRSSEPCALFTAIPPTAQFIRVPHSALRKPRSGFRTPHSALRTQLVHARAAPHSWPFGVLPRLRRRFGLWTGGYRRRPGERFTRGRMTRISPRRRRLSVCARRS